MNEIELRSEDVQEIVAKPPNVLLRSGSAVLLGFFVLFVVGSFVFKYPDVISGEIVIAGSNPPAELKAHTSGKISQLYVADNQSVRVGAVLAELEHTASYSDILAVKSILNKKDSVSFGNIIQILNSKRTGELQNSVSEYIKLLQEYDEFFNLEEHQHKIQYLNTQIAGTERSLSTYRRQIALMQADFELVKKQFYRDSGLFAGKVIALSEFEKSESVFLNKKMSLETLRNTLIESENRISDLRNQITETEIDRKKRSSALKNALNEKSKSLRSEIELWERNYILVSPTDGNVVFSDFWSINQNVNSGDVVFTVVPKTKNRTVGRIAVPAAGAGKLKIGQEVSIALDNYSATEFGILSTKIDHISLVPKNKTFTLTVSLPDSLTSTYGIKIPFSQNMSGRAEIITSELSLAERLINPIKDLAKN